MEIVVLGTGAGESYPGLWCACENCSYARTHGGKNIRGNCSVLIDGVLMIDMPDSALHNAARFGVSLAEVRGLLVTHPHTDHFAPDHLWERNYPNELDVLPREEIVNRRSVPCALPLPCMDIYGTHFVGEAIARAGDVTLPPEEYHFSFHKIQGGDSFETCGYTVTALTAEHGCAGYTVNYIVEKDGLSLLYASDTGGYREDVAETIFRRRFQCVFLETTMGNIPISGRSGHMNLESAEKFLDRLKERGSITEGTQIYLTHLSPHWTPPHDILAPAMEQKGIGVAYDGQTIRVEG